MTTGKTVHRPAKRARKAAVASPPEPVVEDLDLVVYTSDPEKVFYLFSFPKNIRMERLSHRFENFISHYAFNDLGAVSLIRTGMPSMALKAASAFLDVPESRIMSVTHVSPSTANRLQKDNAHIDAAATERLLRLGEITKRAIDVFENKDHAVTWLRTVNRALGDVAPLDLMDTEPGALAVRRVLNAIERGGVV